MIAGAATVVDIDTLEVASVRIRLDGIDGPETKQTCPGGPPELEPCGAMAAAALAEHLGTSLVTCRPSGRDRYGRTLGSCFLGNEDVQAWLIRSGYAMAYRKYSERYVPEEETARAAGVGLWATHFEPPWDWRARQRDRTSSTGTKTAAVTDQHPNGCEIKGNIGSKGKRVYHLPGSPWYARTQPEQWFCSEAEAQGAGFMPPKG